MAADDADDLYGLALDAFVPERDALAKRLRAGGDRAAADGIKALRKPSVAAWAVNQAVRTQPKAARELWDAGDALIAAQDDLLGGSGDAAALRAAVEGERTAVDALVEAARGLLTSDGRDLGEATLERVRETLHAAAIDPEAREDVAAGRATRELAHAGLGAFGASIARPVAPRARKAPAEEEAAGDEAAEAEDAGAKGTGTKARAAPAKGRGRKAAEKGAAEKPRAKKGDAKTSGAKAEAAERRRAEEARREEERRAAAEAEETRREAARRRAAAERELREAARALEKAQRAADRADARLREAEAAADEANAALEDARDRHTEAEAELDAARADAEAAE